MKLTLNELSLPFWCLCALLIANGTLRNVIYARTASGGLSSYYTYRTALSSSKKTVRKTERLLQTWDFCFQPDSQGHFLKRKLFTKMQSDAVLGSGKLRGSKVDLATVFLSGEGPHKSHHLFQIFVEIKKHLTQTLKVGQKNF